MDGASDSTPRVLITSGPTHEHLDDVRFLGNGSSGRMGHAMAAAARAAGCRVWLVSGPTGLAPPAGVEQIDVVSALEMQAAAEARVGEADVVLGVAAVCDYRPAKRWSGKPPRRSGSWQLELVPNPDVLAGLAARRRPGQVFVGFALEAAPAGAGPAAAWQARLARGRDKLAAKHLDLIAVNGLESVGDAEVEIVLLDAEGGEERLPRCSKPRAGAAIVERALRRLARVRGEESS